MTTGDENYGAELERIRRVLSWICLCVFTGTFAGLLGLSATAYWTPESAWIVFLDRAWKISGVAGIVLWAIPRLVRSFRWLRASTVTDG
jgi:hypothetical protein